jgi:lipoprotein-releasing system ATP-binding protein
MSEPGTSLKVDNLAKSYITGRKKLEVLKEISFEIEAASVVAVVGASGVGKSTLLHLLGALDHPDEGTVHYGSVNLFTQTEQELAAFRNKHIGFVFQFHHLLPEFTALENVMMPLLIGRMEKKQAALQAEKLLGEVGLQERLTHKSGELSGGEQQRVAIARALVNNPRVLLADEPTGNLDTQTSESVYRLLQELNQRRGTTFLYVTHNLDLAKMADQIIHLKNGHVANDQ